MFALLFLSYQQKVVIFDAGSSGTRIYLYEYSDPKNYTTFTAMKNEKGEQIVKKMNVPLTDCAEKPELISTIFDDLMKVADKYITEKERLITPILLYATAGMRLLSKENQTIIINKVYNYLAKNYKYSMSPKSIRVIEGYEEAIFAWVAVNRLYNFGQKTLPIAEIGGASMQLATCVDEITSDIKEYIHTIKFGSLSFNLFCYSWLGYGVDQAMKKVHEHLDSESPCFLKGDTLEKYGKTWKGKGLFDECYKLVSEYAYRKCGDNKLFYDGEKCIPRAGSFENAYTLGTFEYSHKALLLPNSTNVTFYESESKTFSSMTIDEANAWYENTHGEKSTQLSNLMTQMVLGVNLFRSGLTGTENITFAAPEALGDTEPQWTLGAVLVNYAKTISISNKRIGLFIGVIIGVVALIAIIVGIAWFFATGSSEDENQTDAVEEHLIV